MDTTNSELGNTVRDEKPAQNVDGQAVRSPAPSLLGHDSEKDSVSPTTIPDATEKESGKNADRVNPQDPDAIVSAGAPNHGEFDEEPGAFDDSHLQVDQAKRKKKKRSKKPKSKRGLVTFSLPIQISADLTYCRTPPLGSRNTVQMLPLHLLSMTRKENSMTCEPYIFLFRTAN